MSSCLRILWLTFFGSLLAAPAWGQWSGNPQQNMVVRDVPDIHEGHCRVVALPTGGAYITWWETDAQLNWWLRLQRLDAQGRRLWDEAGVRINPLARDRFAPLVYDLQVDAADNAVLAYESRIPDSPLTHIVVQKVSPAGTLLWGTAGTALGDPEARGALVPRLAIVGQQQLVVTWNANVPVGDPRGTYVCVQKLSATGQPLWAAPRRLKAPVGTGGVLGSQEAYPLAAGPDEAVLILYYYTVRNTENNFVHYRLYGQRLSASGVEEWAQPTLLSSRITPEYYPYITADPFFVSDGAGGCYVSLRKGGIYVQHLSRTGVTWSPEGIQALPASTAPLEAQTAPMHFDAARQELYVVITQHNRFTLSHGLTLQKFRAQDGTLLLGPGGQEVLPLQTANPTALGLHNTGRDLLLPLAYQRNAASQQRDLGALRLTYAGKLVGDGGPVTLTGNSRKSGITQALLADGQLALVWVDTNQSSGVYAQNLTPNGTLGTLVTATRPPRPAESLVHLFPNPAAAPTLRLPVAGLHSVVIQAYDLVGREVKCQYAPVTGSNDSWRLTGPTLPPGTYLVYVTVGGQRHLVRWLKP